MATYKPTSSSGTTYTSLNENDVIEGNYTGKVIPVTVPKGVYKLECWGAQGGIGQTAFKNCETIYQSSYSSYFSIQNLNWYNSSTLCATGSMNGGTYWGIITFLASGVYHITYEVRSSSSNDFGWISYNGTIPDNNDVISGGNSKAIKKTFSAGETVTFTYSNGSGINGGIYIKIRAQEPDWDIDSNDGGYGGYSTGILKLYESTLLYMTPGGKGTDNVIIGYDFISSGGFNGGGNSVSVWYEDTQGGEISTSGGGGGGASDIRIKNNSLYSRVIVAGGGGGSASSTSTLTYKQGGGLIGKADSSYAEGYEATQTRAGLGGSFGQGGSVTGSLGQAFCAGGGGGGWYGGGAEANSESIDTKAIWRNGGGSGYVYTKDTAVNYPSGCTLNSNYYLTEASTNYDTHKGNGLVKITYLGKLNLGYVKTSSNTWSKINNIYVKTADDSWTNGIEFGVKDTSGWKVEKF